MAWLTGNIDTNGIKTHYHRTGGDKPALVIAHGITDNGRTWSRIARELADTYDVIIYDLRGHGLSDAPANGYTFEAYADDLFDLIVKLKLEHIHLLGHSAGAMIATLFAASHPTLTTSLILEDPAWGTAWGDWDAVEVGMTEWFLRLKAKPESELTTYCRESNPTWLDEDVVNWVESKLQVHPNAVRLLEHPMPQWLSAVGQISCPVLIITADLDKGAMNTPADAQAVAAACQQGQTAHIDGAGHMIHQDQFAAYLVAVRSFLASADSS